MNKLKEIIFSCRKATYLIDKRLAGKISFWEAVELHIHLTGCDVCCIYRKQSAKINLLISNMLKHEEKAAIRLDDAYKERLQLQINKIIKN